MKDPLFLTIPRNTVIKDREPNPDDDDEDDGDSEPAGYGEGDFIRLQGGRLYIRKFEIVGVAWEEYLASDINEKSEMAWCLRVFFSDCPNMRVYGEEAADLMRSFGLPEEPPER
jgi:hypothetical protein